MDEPRAYVIPLAIWTVLAGALITHWSGLHPIAAVAWVLWLALAMIALLAQTSAGGRDYLRSTLWTSHYTPLYRSVARPLNDWVWRRVGRMRLLPDGTEAPPPVTTAIWPLLRAALTWRLLDRALLIAVVYPLVALLLPWLLGGDAVLGAGVVAFPAAEFWPDRALAMFFVGNFCLVLSFAIWSREVFVANPFFSFILILLALAMIASIYGSNLIHGHRGEDSLFRLIFQRNPAAALSGIVAIGFMMAMTFSFALAKRSSLFHPRWSRTIIVIFGVYVALGVAIFFSAAYISLNLRIGTTRENFDFQLIIVFSFFLPLINVLYDALSYAITLALSRKGLATRWAPVWGLIDLALGAVLFLALGATMVAVIATLNAIGTAPIHDLAALFAGLRASPGDYWWLYLILFSTLAPTSLHLLIAALAVQGWFVFQRPRRAVAGWIAAAPTSHPAAVAGFFCQTMIWWLPLMALVVLGWVLWQVIGTAAGAAGLIYLDALEWLSRWIGVI